MKRFKTKQEFKEENMGGPRNWNEKMDIYFGVPWETEGECNPHDLCQQNWDICYYHLTNMSHPYEGKDFLITFDEGTDTELLQKKCFALGYSWSNSGQEYVKYIDCGYFHITEQKEIKRGTTRDITAFHHSTPKLTLKEFMSGDRIKRTITNTAIQGDYMNWRASNMPLPQSSYFDMGGIVNPSAMPWSHRHMDLKINMTSLISDDLLHLNSPAWSEFEKEIKESNPISLISNKSKTNQDGRIIKVQRVTPTITGGERPKGCSISGRTGRTTIAVGHLSYKAITG